MTPLRALDTYQFPTRPHWVGTLNVRAAAVALQNGLPLSTWDDDGLGEAMGFVCSIPSGRVVLVEEHRHQMEHLGGQGANISADEADVAQDGAEAILAETLEALGLSQTHVAQVPAPGSREP